MTLDKLIQMLQAINQEHGDLPVHVVVDGDYGPARTVEVGADSAGACVFICEDYCHDS